MDKHTSHLVYSVQLGNIHHKDYADQKSTGSISHISHLEPGRWTLLPGTNDNVSLGTSYYQIYATTRLSWQPLHVIHV